MTDLNLHLNSDTIANSKKLKNIKCQYYYVKEFGLPITLWIFNPLRMKNRDYSFPAPKIADVINRAKSIFTTEWKNKQNEILKMCQQNKSLEDIEKYVLANI